MRISFTDLEQYTKKIQEDKKFYTSDYLIDIDEYANSISIDYGQNHVTLRFENHRTLVKTIINNKTERVVMDTHKVPRYLRELNINVMEMITDIPYFRRVLAD